MSGTRRESHTVTIEGATFNLDDLRYLVKQTEGWSADCVVTVHTTTVLDQRDQTTHKISVEDSHPSTIKPKIDLHPGAPVGTRGALGAAERLGLHNSDGLL